MAPWPCARVLKIMNAPFDMETQSYPVRGMHCAACASIIEKTIRKQPGVKSAEVSYGTETAKVAFDPAATDARALSKAIEPLGYSIAVREEQAAGQPSRRLEKEQELAELRLRAYSALPLAAISIFVMGWQSLEGFGVVSGMSRTLEELVHHFMAIAATYVLFVVGRPYLVGMIRFFRHGAANMDTLIGIGTTAAFIYSFVVTALEETVPFFAALYRLGGEYYDATIVVIAFISLGKFIEARSKLKTGDAIEKLLGLQAKKARVLRDGAALEIPIDQVRVGEHPSRRAHPRRWRGHRRKLFRGRGHGLRRADACRQEERRQRRRWDHKRRRQPDLRGDQGR
jgi:P-type Cu+ transporter